MNLKQIIADGAYTVFARMGDENKFKQIEAVQYIKQLASTTEVDIEDWDIMSVFGTGRGNNLFIDRREINKRFMEQAQKSDVAKVTKEDPKVDPAIARLQAEANNMIRDTLVQRIRDMEHSRTRALRDAINAAAQHRQHLAKAVEHQASIRALSKSQVDFASHLRAVQEGGFWKYIKFENGRLFFRTVNDLVLRHRNVSAGVDFKVNFGKFEATYDIRAGYIQVHKFENNIDIQGTIHPHVSGGSVCWGAASETMHNKVLAFDVSGVMQLLANLLSDYCDENPYRTMFDFKYEQYVVEAIKMRQQGKSDEEVTKFFKENDVDEEYIGYFFDERDPGRNTSGRW